MKSHRLTLLLALAIGMTTLTGCLSVNPDADQTLTLVDRTRSVSLDTIDAFLKFEFDNQAAIKAKLPQVHAFAESLRVNVPKYMKDIDDARAAYVAVKSAANGNKLSAALGVVEELSKLAGQYLLSKI